MLSKVESQQGDLTATETYTYDNYKRLKKKVDEIAVYGVTYDYTYDNLGRVLTESKKVQNMLQMNHTVKVKKHYKNGYLWKLTDANTNQLLKEYNSLNARGQVTEFTLGNGLKTVCTYDDYGYLTKNEVNKTNGSNLFTLHNTWDIQRGNLTWRQTTLFKKATNPYYNEPLSESFTYDSFDRLVSSTGYWGMRLLDGGIGFPGQPTPISNVVYRDNTSYDGRGRITENNVGEYSYNSSKMYQLAQIDNMPQDQLTYYQQNPLQQVTYNARKAPLSILQQGKENIYFDYDGFDNRRFMYYGNEGEKAQSPKLKYYSAAGDVEIEYDSATNHARLTIYVDGGPYDASIIVRKETNSPAGYHYLHRDYLGSILAITNSAGNIVEKRHFDAWGSILRGELTFLDRGYTGHEHLQGVGLINMNARLYDPKLHRFLAPDNFIQDPSNSQNYNRYGYVLNNPLKYNDESGEFIFTAVTAVFNAVKEFVQHGVNFDHYDWHQTNMAWKIDMGMFEGNFGQLLAKWNPWGLFNNAVGNIAAHAFNLAGNVKDVTYLEGAVALDTTRDGGAFTLGYYINGPRGFKADWKDHLFVHEYGHSIQGNMFGPLYLPIVATTSLSSAAGLGGDDHDSRWFEIHASRLGGKFFDKQYGSGANDYYKGSPNHFDYKSYSQGGKMPYDNPRYVMNPIRMNNWSDSYPTTGARFSIWDIVVPLFSLSSGTPFIIF